ncbi:MAG: hypothetical protein WC340_11195 [Kiritimatiellia bacterium]
MNYLAVKDLKAPLLVRETLAKYGSALVTNNGVPMALMVQIAPDEDPLELEQAIRLTRARLAVSAIRRENQKRRELSMADVDKEIKAVRTERKARLAQV